MTSANQQAGDEERTRSPGQEGSGATVGATDAPAISAPETPSGKGAGDENFPVGSFLLPKALRPHVAVYYDFARAIDDIADNGALSAEDRIARLTAFDEALCGTRDHESGFEKAHRLRVSLLERGISLDRGRDLIKAFILDCQKTRYDNWAELLHYCSLSANPVGQYLLDLHGEDPRGYRYSDALCTVLQIVNHLQDCKDDLHEIDRIYVIGDWLRDQGGDYAMIDAASAPPALRATFDRMLDGCDQLMEEARQLPSVLKSRSLAMESAVIVRLADRLITLLRGGDPIAGRVALKKLDFVVAGMTGAVSGFWSAGRIDLDKAA